MLEEAGNVFAVFDRQDSGCWSAGIETPEGRWFVKLATTEAAHTSMQRVRELHQHVQHPAIVPLVHGLTCADGLVNIYPWESGEVLYHPTVGTRPDRTDPSQPMARFRALPLHQAQGALQQVLDAHERICDAGWIAVDFYDGCTMYDFTAHQMRLIDFDEYRPEPFDVPGDRLPGSSRYLAPEELRHSGRIDQRATVHALGRMLRLLLDAGDHEAAWRGTTEQLDVIRKATDPDPARRWPTVHDLNAAWITTR
ncbi:serine/threonine protein kinase [Streptacidiphilus sp. NEAU-YB345]|uniref:Serine/threonine protein kinase n=1 Tax=Streptacidiphilus fuscans TaxID=2789292 RepID=A0A931B5S6_9ACTN|nr:serine/threonine protein kinase [Streptacidiphilus fuscans]